MSDPLVDLERRAGYPGFANFATSNYRGNVSVALEEVSDCDGELSECLEHWERWTIEQDMLSGLGSSSNKGSFAVCESVGLDLITNVLKSMKILNSQNVQSQLSWMHCLKDKAKRIWECHSVNNEMDRVQWFSFLLGVAMFSTKTTELPDVRVGAYLHDLLLCCKLNVGKKKSLDPKDFWTYNFNEIHVPWKQFFSKFVAVYLGFLQLKAEVSKEMLSKSLKQQLVSKYSYQQKQTSVVYRENFLDFAGNDAVSSTLALLKMPIASTPGKLPIVPQGFRVAHSKDLTRLGLSPRTPSGSISIFSPQSEKAPSSSQNLPDQNNPKHVAFVKNRGRTITFDAPSTPQQQQQHPGTMGKKPMPPSSTAGLSPSFSSSIYASAPSVPPLASFSSPISRPPLPKPTVDYRQQPTSQFVGGLQLSSSLGENLGPIRKWEYIGIKGGKRDPDETAAQVVLQSCAADTLDKFGLPLAKMSPGLFPGISAEVHADEELGGVGVIRPEQLLVNTLDLDEAKNALLTYVIKCSQLKIIPLPRIVGFCKRCPIRFMLKNVPLLDPAMTAFSEALQCVVSIRELHLVSLSITNIGIDMLCRGLNTSNTNITTLNISHNPSVGLQAGSCFAALLDKKSRMPLVTVDFSFNQLGESGTDAICGAVRYNTILKTLNLAGNGISAVGCEGIQRVLRTNSTLTHLDLSWNHIRFDAAKHISDGIGRNKMLKTLVLSWNGFGDVGPLHDLLVAIRRSKVELLDLSHNRINERGAVMIADYLDRLPSVRRLILDGNAIKKNGGRTISRNLVSKSQKKGGKAPIKVSMKNCSLDVDVDTDFDANDPMGSYDLCMDDPHDRAVVRQLTILASKGFGHFVDPKSDSASQSGGIENGASISIDDIPTTGNFSFFFSSSFFSKDVKNANMDALREVLNNCETEEETDLVLESLGFETKLNLHQVINIIKALKGDKLKAAMARRYFHRMNSLPLTATSPKGKFLGVKDTIMEDDESDETSVRSDNTPKVLPSPSNAYDQAKEKMEIVPMTPTIEEETDNMMTMTMDFSDAQTDDGRISSFFGDEEFSIIPLLPKKPANLWNDVDFDTPIEHHPTVIFGRSPSSAALRRAESGVGRSSSPKLSIGSSSFRYEQQMLLDALPQGAKEEVLEQVKATLHFHPDNPTGHYRLDLRSQRDIAMMLLDCRTKELATIEPIESTNPIPEQIWINCTIDGERVAEMDEEWKPPKYGILEFDYMCKQRPPPDVEPIAKGPFKEFMQELEQIENEEQLLASLHEVFCSHYLTSVQALRLLKLFKITELKALFIMNVYSRLVDRHGLVNLLYSLSYEEAKITYTRIGRHNVWDEVTAIGWYELDLSLPSDRWVMAQLVRLAVLEPGDNLVGGILNNLPFDVPSGWTKEIPHRKPGQLSIYYCRNAAVIESVKAMVEPATLPMNYDAIQPPDDGWIMGHKRLRVFEIMQSRFSAAEQVFKAINTDNRGYISRKELAIGLVKINVSLDPYLLRDLMATLDSDGSGTVELEEFRTFWNNMQNSNGVLGMLMKAYGDIPGFYEDEEEKVYDPQVQAAFNRIDALFSQVQQKYGLVKEDKVVLPEFTGEKASSQSALVININ